MFLVPKPDQSISTVLQQERNTKFHLNKHRNTFIPVIKSVPLTFVRAVVADVSDGFSHHPLVVHVGSGRDLTTKQHHARLTHRLCFNTEESDQQLTTFIPD